MKASHLVKYRLTDRWSSARAAKAAQRAKDFGRRVVPLVAVPFMGRG